MRIIARRTLREFVESRAGHKDQAALKAALDAWFDEVRKARWTSTADVKRLYATASIVTSQPDRLQYQGQRLPAGGVGRFREGHRLDQVDRHSQGLRQD